MKNINIFIKLLLSLMFFVIILNIGTSKITYAADPIGDIKKSANNFLDAKDDPSVKDKDYVDGESVKKASDSLYLIFTTIGLAVALIVGAILGIQFVTAGVEEKAKVKESLVAYGIGLGVLVGAYTIWEIVVTLFPDIIK